MQKRKPTRKEKEKAKGAKPKARSRRSRSTKGKFSTREDVEAGVPFFLKQMEVDGRMVKMPLFEGKVWNQFPEEKK